MIKHSSVQIDLKSIQAGMSSYTARIPPSKIVLCVADFKSNAIALMVMDVRRHILHGRVFRRLSELQNFLFYLIFASIQLIDF